MNQVLAKIGKAGVVPVIVIKDAEHAVPVCRALADGGLPVAEITFRTSAAAESIARVSAELGEVLVGAGTVLSDDQADAAIKAGAKFIVSPGFSPSLVEHCQQRGVPVTPGCATPTDLTMAVEQGLEVVKFFPAEALGGTAMLKAMAAPFGMLSFVPTGGIDASNAGAYLGMKQVLAVGGSWMCTSAMIEAGDWAGISVKAAEAVALAAAARGG